VSFPYAPRVRNADLTDDELLARLEAEQAPNQWDTPLYRRAFVRALHHNDVKTASRHRAAMRKVLGQ
jgi:hypothetical protein